MIVFLENSATTVYSTLLHIADRERFALTFPSFAPPRSPRSCLSEGLLLRPSQVKCFDVMLFVPLVL